MPVTPPDALRDLGLLHPTVVRRFRDVLDALSAVLLPLGYKVLVTETYRTKARQDFLYTLGRTAPGKVVTWTTDSAHEYGYAIDWVPTKNGVAVWDAKIYERAYAAVNLKNYGLERLSFEMPHIQVVGGQAAARRAGIKTNFRSDS